ncbi:hypothetical protein GEV33_013177 [Tenebrio molitor]|uniref:Ig-like domain-containing protein n=1 Tax=Tenebrio molitor TaxID=7067 RepID=A0A8J6L6P6_TENMO|nr:hypothetical protein GEV33_013177 [Tenebrio molitor]
MGNLSESISLSNVPEEDPVMTFEKDLLEMGYTIRGNCTAPPSYPPVNITWSLNGKKINESSVKYIPLPNAIVTENRRQPFITQSALELEIDSSTFEGGKARLQCVANLFNLYKREVELILEEEKPRPRPSSELRTRDAAGISAKKQEERHRRSEEDTWISRMRDTKRFIDDKDSWEIQKALREIDRSGGDEGDSGIYMEIQEDLGERDTEEEIKEDLEVMEGIQRASREISRDLGEGQRDLEAMKGIQVEDKEIQGRYREIRGKYRNIYEDTRRSGRNAYVIRRVPELGDKEIQKRYRKIRGRYRNIYGDPRDLGHRQKIWGRFSMGERFKEDTGRIAEIQGDPEEIQKIRGDIAKSKWDTERFTGDTGRSAEIQAYPGEIQKIRGRYSQIRGSLKGDIARSERDTVSEGVEGDPGWKIQRKEKKIDSRDRELHGRYRENHGRYMDVPGDARRTGRDSGDPQEDPAVVSFLRRDIKCVPAKVEEHEKLNVPEGSGLFEQTNDAYLSLVALQTGKKRRIERLTTNTAEYVTFHSDEHENSSENRTEGD